jgi:hypothetical protein
MSAPYNPNIDLHVSHGGGLHLDINGRPVDNTYGTIVMAELAALREQFAAVRVDVHLHAQNRPTPAQTARLINIELDRNQIWDRRPTRRTDTSDRVSPQPASASPIANRRWQVSEAETRATRSSFSALSRGMIGALAFNAAER